MDLVAWAVPPEGCVGAPDDMPPDEDDDQPVSRVEFPY